LFALLQERDASISKLREAEREIELLKDRLEASQVGWSESRRQLDDKVCNRCDVHPAHRGPVANVFLDALSQLLSDSRILVEPNEERIKDRVRDLLHTIRDKNAVS
jgi:hypothetical protein